MDARRIGVIGLGQRIAHVLAAMAETGWDLNLAGYSDPAPVGLSILGDVGIPPGRSYRDEAELLADGPFDLVMIGSPNHLRLAHIKAALAAGFPIFSEKPIVRTREETLELARRLAAAEAPPLFIGLVMRSMPIVREVLARVRGRELGELISIDATEHLHPEHGAYLARNWRRKGEWGGSFMLDKVCHDFDIFATPDGWAPMTPSSPIWTFSITRQLSCAMRAVSPSPSIPTAMSRCRNAAGTSPERAAP
jgi:predicted dehydrogenase